MKLVGLLIWIALAALVGLRLPLGRVGLGVRALAGVVALHFALVAMDALRVSWSRTALLILAVGVAFGARKALAEGRDHVTVALSGFGWGDAVALVSIACFGWVTVTLQAVHSDFVYHWGVKGQRFAMARGIDWTFLTFPEGAIFHPDYPHLVPNAYAAIAVLSGVWSERAILLTNVALVVILWLVVREGLARLGVEGVEHQAGVASIVGLVAGFAIYYNQAGGADLPMAISLTAAGLMLCVIDRASSESSPMSDFLGLGFVLAFLATSKLEGLVAAVWLGLVFLLFMRRQWLAKPLRLLAVAGPAAAVVVPWFVAMMSLGLLRGTGSAHALQTDRLTTVAGAVFEVMTASYWQMLPLLLFTLPVLLVIRRTRMLALVVLGPMVVYGVTFLTSENDPVMYIAMTVPRLLLHFLPTTVVAIVVALGLRERAC